MNSVNLVGTLTADPELRQNRAGMDECRMRIAVPRYKRTGRREPGVSYIYAVSFGGDARDCVARLKEGARIGLSGRLDTDDYRAVLIDQLDFL